MRKLAMLPLLALTGCATIMGETPRDVSVVTNPPGLTARINTQQCITPCILKNVEVNERGFVHITFNGVERAYRLDRPFNILAGQSAQMERNLVKSDF